MITSFKLVIIRIVTLFCDPNLNSLFNQFNISSQTHDFEDPGNIVNCKYYNLEEVQTMKIPNKKSSLSLFHINTCFFNHKFLGSRIYNQNN